MQPLTRHSRALVVYESMFGNTRMIAEAVAAGLRPSFDDIELTNAAEAPSTLDGVDLLVVGAPTHAFGLPRSSTRESAGRDGAAEPRERGVREWLESLPAPAHPVTAAAFDTRIRGPFPGSARRPITRRLRKRGCRVLRPRSFVVTGSKGPLHAGSLDDARTWGAGLRPAGEAVPVG